MVKLRVKNAKFIRVRHLIERSRGELIPIEALRDVPFEIKRIFFIRGVKDSRVVRGEHAHTRARQVLLCVHGSCVLHLDDGSKKQKILMRDPAVGILIHPDVWVRMTNFSRDCVLCAVADEYFDRDEYINEYDAFIARKRKRKIDEPRRRK